MFNLGDIVKPKFTNGTIKYYIVTDVYDFSEDGDGSEVVYEVMKIYPVTSRFVIQEDLDEDKVALLAKVDSKDHKMILDFVIRERMRYGWDEEPDFMNILKMNQKVHNVKENLQQIKDDIYGIASRKIEDFELDVVRYDKLGTIDKCLDALNDLKMLHEMFGDEAFLQLREVVQNRLKDLI